MEVHAVSPAASSPSTLSPSTSSSSPSAFTTRLNITPRARAYDSSLLTQPTPGYTQNHAKFPEEYARWARKAASGESQNQTHKASGTRSAASTGSAASATGPANEAGSAVEKHEIAILVSMGVVTPGRNHIKHIGVSILLNHDFMFVYSITYNMIGLRRRT